MSIFPLNLCTSEVLGSAQLAKKEKNLLLLMLVRLVETNAYTGTSANNVCPPTGPKKQTGCLPGFSP